jgi:hypothetical protein
LRLHRLNLKKINTSTVFLSLLKEFWSELFKFLEHMGVMIHAGGILQGICFCGFSGFNAFGCIDYWAVHAWFLVSLHCMTNSINRMYVVRNSNKNELFTERTGIKYWVVVWRSSVSSRIPFLLMPLYDSENTDQPSCP